MKTKPFSIVAQPTETTCGPTCLHSVYQHFKDSITLPDVISEIPENEHGGTYSVMLANHALKRGYVATIYSYNLRVFDPTWCDLHPSALHDKLAARHKAIRSKRGRANLKAYMSFLQLGGNVRFDELSTELLARLLSSREPIIAGLNSNHLYRTIRVGSDGLDDDIAGEVDGHFVTLFEYNRTEDQVSVADPYQKNPLSDSLYYNIDTQRLINAIMLGIVTYDANLLIIRNSDQQEHTI